ncbi:hypothetical protein ACLOJK_022652, partial [Asimina triloba]
LHAVCDRVRHALLPTRAKQSWPLMDGAGSRRMMAMRRQGASGSGQHGRWNVGSSGGGGWQHRAETTSACKRGGDGRDDERPGSTDPGLADDGLEDRGIWEN